jgi:hypothetical protein
MDSRWAILLQIQLIFSLCNSLVIILFKICVCAKNVLLARCAKRSWIRFRIRRSSTRYQLSSPASSGSGRTMVIAISSLKIIYSSRLSTGPISQKGSTSRQKPTSTKIMIKHAELLTNSCCVKLSLDPAKRYAVEALLSRVNTSQDSKFGLVLRTLCTFKLRYARI